MKTRYSKEFAVLTILLGSIFWASSTTAKVISNNFYLETYGGEVFSGSFTTKDIGTNPGTKEVGLEQFSLTGPGGIFWDQDDFLYPALTAVLNPDQTTITAINGSGMQTAQGGAFFSLDLFRDPRSMGGYEYQWGGLLLDSDGMQWNLGAQVIPEPGVLALLGIGLLGFGASRWRSRSRA